MTYDVFVSCWQALVMEMCDGLMAEATAATPQAKAEAQAHLDLMRVTVVDFIMSVCSTDCSIVQRAQLHNMNTGARRALVSRLGRAGARWVVVGEGRRSRTA